VSNVVGDIIVNDGAVLAVENATINMDRYYSDGGWKYSSIISRDNGTLNVNGSTIMRYDSNSAYYGWRYESGAGIISRTVRLSSVFIIVVSR